MRWAWFPMMLLTGASLRTRPAHAEGARFSWAGPDCAASAPWFRNRLEKLVDAPDLARLAGSVSVARKGADWLVEVAIDLDGAHLGERRFPAKSCDHAAETAAVAASMAVFDGGAVPEVAVASGISADIWTRKPDPVPESTSESPALAPSPSRSRLEPRLGLLGVAEVGALPASVLGVGVEAELGFGERWSAALVGSVTTEQERVVGDEKLARLRAFAATARGCVAPAFGPAYRIDGCAGLRFMLVRGQGDGFDVNREASLEWLAPLVGFNLSLRGPRYIEWRLELDASLPLSRRRFLVDGQQVSRSQPVVLGLRLGPVLRF